MLLKDHHPFAPQTVTNNLQKSVVRPENIQKLLCLGSNGTSPPAGVKIVKVSCFSYTLVLMDSVVFTGILSLA